MIDIREAEPINSLPDIVANQAWVRALSYSFSQMIRRILDITEATRTFSAVDRIDRHDILDALAVDLLVKFYDVDYDLKTKRRLVKYALQYWATAGSVKATEDVAKRVLGDCFITEWFEYEGRPGYFKVGISDNSLTSSDIQKFKNAVENVKRLSAWFDGVFLDMQSEMKQHYGFFDRTGDITEVKHERDPNQLYGFFAFQASYEKIRQER